METTLNAHFSNNVERSKISLLFIRHNKAITLLSSILVIISLCYFFDLRDYFTTENISLIFKKNLLISWVFFIFLFFLGGVLQIPGVIFLTAAVLTLGATHGFLLTYISTLVAGTLHFFMVNFVGGDSLKKVKLKWVSKMLEKINQKPLLTMVILRLVLQVSPPLNYTLALTGVTLKDYILAILIGIPIPYSIYTILISHWH